MTESDDPNLRCAHFIACHTLWYDSANLDAGYSLGRVIVQLRPPASDVFAFTVPRLFLYAQLWGTLDEYTLRIRLVRAEDEDDPDAPEFGPWDVALVGDVYVEAFGFSLTQVPFAEPGVYEFQLWADGFDEPIGRERIEVRERDDAN
jgi:hypothetical protein